jgi:hypothetical protein
LTACAGQVFTINKTDASQDKYEFVPTTPATPVVLHSADAGGNPAQCVIDFSVVVVKVPTKDARPDPVSDPGVQTNELGGANGTASDNQTGQGTGTNNTTVAPATLPISTQVTPTSLVLGGAFHDTATFAPPAGAAVPTGTVTFNVFGPGDPTCTGTPTFTSTNELNAAGTSATSGTFTPTSAGTWQVVAVYNGDANYAAVTSLCNDPKESLLVSVTTPPPPPPPVVTPPPPPPVTCTPPPGPAPPGGKLCSTPPTSCTTPPGPAPAGGTLCTRGTAAISGKTGCQGAPFNVVVSGHQISRVVFTLDGKVIKTLRRPNSGTRYKLPVRPGSLKSGTHHIVARTIFAAKSGTKSKTLRVTFSRCAHQAALPAFTG